jgi:hypothetical protein
MKALPLLLLVACGGVGVELPPDALIDFSITPTVDTPAIECTGRIDMPKSMARFTCQDFRTDPPTAQTVDVTMEYIHRPTEAWLHFMAIGSERDHYPTYNGVALAVVLRPNGEGTGWIGDALYYPRDSRFGYEGFAATAFRGH